MRNKAEILAPAGSFDALTAAVRCGADAVYLGGRELNARRNAANFSSEELAQAVEYCHARGVKVYVTLNTLVRDDEMETALKAVECACDIKADALILQDIGLISLVSKAAPDMPMHASTQMSVQTLDGVKMLADMGFVRAVLPRELSKKEIEKIAVNSPIELELFVHGALCMCLSGQCLLSAVLGSRSGNRGLCAQPCRLPFAAAGGTGHDLSLKDLSLVEELPELADMGIASFKIEGRMKRPEYVAAAVTACRKSLAGEDSGSYERTLGAVFSRSGFTSGYYDGELGRGMFGVRRKEDVTAAKDVLSPLAALYNGEQPLIKADMYLSAHAGKRAGLAVKAMGKSVFVKSNEPVQRAQNRTVGSDELTARLRKCGSTQFFAGEIETDIGGDIFLSAAQINSMRREALSELGKRIAERPEIKFTQPELNVRRRRAQNRGFVIRVHNISQIPRNLTGVRRIVLPMNAPADVIDALKEKKIQPAAEVPAAIFGGDEAVFNALIRAHKNGVSLAAVCSLDGAAIAKKAGMKLCALPGTNIFNTFSLDKFASLGFTDAVLSAELKLAQCAELGGSLPRGIFAYGRLPLMQTRNCPVKNGTACAECKKHGRLTDRMGVEFPVECTPFASTLLNSVPVAASDKLDQFGFADFSLLWFTTETRDECEMVLDSYRRGAAPQGEFTRGLLYRGVE